MFKVTIQLFPTFLVQWRCETFLWRKQEGDVIQPTYGTSEIYNRLMPELVTYMLMLKLESFMLILYWGKSWKCSSFDTMLVQNALNSPVVLLHDKVVYYKFSVYYIYHLHEWKSSISKWEVPCFCGSSWASMKYESASVNRTFSHASYLWVWLKDISPTRDYWLASMTSLCWNASFPQLAINVLTSNCKPTVWSQLHCVCRRVTKSVPLLGAIWYMNLGSNILNLV